MSVATVNQKEYLKKYLSGGSGDKKKKKRKKLNQPGRVQIVDDDIDLNSLQPLDDGDYNLYELAEDAPQIAGIVDERPEEVKALELFRGSKWKIIQDENGIEDIKVTEERYVKCRDEPEDRFRDVDIVPPVSSWQNREDNTGKVHKKKPKLPSEDSDASPPRRSRAGDSDESPPRKGGSRKSSDTSKRTERHSSKKSRSSPSARDARDTKSRNTSETDDSDISPPRRSSSKSIPYEHVRKTSKIDSDSDVSPPRARRKKEDSDESPPRKSRPKSNSNEGYKRKSRFDRDSDESPPRKLGAKPYSNEVSSRKSRHDRDSDESPPRKPRNEEGSNMSPQRKPKPFRKKSRFDVDYDQSPPRKFPSKGDFDEYLQKSKNQPKSERPIGKEPTDSRIKTEKAFQRGGSDSDESPPRRKGSNNMGNVKERLPAKPSKLVDRIGKEGSSKKVEKQDRTLEGKKAGLQDAKALRMENLEHQLKEKEVFAKMSDEVSGRNAATVMRDRATGKKRDLAREAAESAVEKEKEDKKKEKYSRWGKGIKQVEEQQSRLHEDLYEMSKPLARYADDKDLESYLKEQEREGDPMQEYIRSQKLKMEKENPSLSGEKKKFPVYQGPQPPPNRFGIRPGYRWDGVDRSTGFEQKWFQEQNARKALQEESHKWSTEDM